MIRSIARMMDPITKGGHKNYKRKKILWLKKGIYSEYKKATQMMLN
jgi:hypothetical protein